MHTGSVWLPLTAAVVIVLLALPHRGALVAHLLVIAAGIALLLSIPEQGRRDVGGSLTATEVFAAGRQP